jgi:hypothetical protein
MESVFSIQEINRLKSDASQLFMYARSFLTIASELMLIDRESALPDLHLKYVPIPTKFVRTPKAVKVYYRNLAGSYAVDLAGNMELYQIEDTSRGIFVNYLNYVVSSVTKKSGGKTVATIQSLGAIGYNYCEPNTPLPQVLLTPSGAIRGLN